MEKSVGSYKSIENCSGSSQSSESFFSKLFWKGAVFQPLLHVIALHAIYRICTFQVHLYTIIFQAVLLPLTLIGVVGGAHRLWSHRAYKAKWPLRLFLVVFHTMAFQASVRWWAKKHRVHHKYTDTAADPHDSTRGFFYCHIGWFMMKQTPECKQRLSEVDVSDLDSDPILYWQARLYYQVWWPILFVLVPTMTPVLCWDEDVVSAWHVNVLRFIIGMHQIFFVNSFAHGYGMKPYDTSISAVESLNVAIHAVGEGWHNYHHVFPWDYKASELPGFLTYNPTTWFIDLCAVLGLAYDLKTTTPQQILARKLRTGDKQIPKYQERFADIMSDGDGKFDDEREFK